MIDYQTRMQIRFSKMHGLGNDFMVARWPASLPVPDREQVQRWGDRRLGVGFDQLLLVMEPAPGEQETRYRIFNQDGGEVEQCGNGARCIAQFLSPAADSRVNLRSAGGPVEARVEGGGRVSVSFGEPSFDPASLPFRAPERRERYRLTVAGTDVEFGAVSLGNPHAVIEVDSVERAPVGILGPALAAHPDFPQSVNVGFAEFVDAGHIRLRVYERGAGETLACGTGAAAAVAVGRRWGRLAESVEVRLPGGTLTVRWPGPGAPLWQTGPTTKVYEGQIEL
ncbi:MAG TPA: diaminopimelate epimerase [Gammaproteobacteria bacterium]|nr:diaminopimelate epimerase [Gammaproteobacteria bacterium]